MPSKTALDIADAQEPGRNRRPEAMAADREFVPGALFHWRTIHGISYMEAQPRIGLASHDKTWANWERGNTAPSYRNLLRILSATGLGFWVPEPARLEADAEERLLMDQRRVQDHNRMNSRRKRAPGS